MLPTPSTSHVAFDRVYEPAEDSYLLLDTLSSETEKAFLHERFQDNPNAGRYPSPAPLVVEIGIGSGVVLAFLHAHAETILGRSDVLTFGVDVNRFACKATEQTVRVVETEHSVQGVSHGFYLGNAIGDLALSLKPREIDVLVFNPPYVPTAELPSLPEESSSKDSSHDNDSHLLALSYAGGTNGMETTDRLLETLDSVLHAKRGCAYVLLCAQNQPEKVQQRIRNWGRGWRVERVGSSGKKAGWEKLQIIRICRIPTAHVE